MTELYVEWETFKKSQPGYKIYYTEDENEYTLIIVKKDFVYICVLIKDIDVEQIREFEEGYKADAIKVGSIDDGIAMGYNMIE